MKTGEAYPVVFVLHAYRVQYARNMALKKDIIGALCWNAIIHVCFQRQKVENGLHNKKSESESQFHCSVCLA